jgi:hypothetical protein
MGPESSKQKLAEKNNEQKQARFWSLGLSQ